MAIYLEDRAEQPKNPRKALLLALLLGPIGMFYATVTWASIMLFMNLIFGVITYGLAILILWPIGANIAYNVVRERNRELLQEKNSSPNGVFQIGKARSLAGIKLISKGASPLDASKNTILPAQPNLKSAAGTLILPLSVWLYRVIIKKGVLGTLRRAQFSGNSVTRVSVREKPTRSSVTYSNKHDMIESRLTRLKEFHEKGLIDEDGIRGKEKSHSG